MDVLVLPEGWSYEYIDSVSSTQDIALAKLSAGILPPPFVIHAGQQQAGRGRLQRKWNSPKGNLYATTVLELAAEKKKTCYQLGMIASLAMQRALRVLCPQLTIACKWPNDLLVGDKKLSGFLLEISDKLLPRLEQPQRPDTFYMLIGSGVNLTSAPVAQGWKTTSLCEYGYHILPQKLLFLYTRFLACYVTYWCQHGFAQLQQKWISACPHIGKSIVVSLVDGSKVTAVMEGVDPQGHLRLCTGEEKKVLHSGEILLAGYENG